MTVSLYAFVFGNIAGMSTNGVPQFAFYLCSNAIWSFFATCVTSTSNTFTANAAIMGKVYFPRLVMPISAVITAIMDLAIQVFMLLLLLLFYAISGNYMFFGPQMLLAIVIIMQTALLGLGCGIIVAALTTKYRDLVILVSFGIQLWMYASPVVYTTSIVPEKAYKFYMLNPMAPIISMWRDLLLKTSESPGNFWGISWMTTLILLILGVMLFSKIEKTFMDTV